MSRIPVRKIVIIAVFAALSLVCMLIKFPLFLPFLEYDFADVPIIIFTMMYGPIYGLLLTAIVCAVQGFTVSIQSGILGILMHFAATGSFVLTFGFIFRKYPTLKGAIIGAFGGILVWTGIMIPFNILITPIFMGVAREAVYPILLPAIIPFNLIKSTGNSAISISLYFILKRVLKNHFDKFSKF
jgi:riboflavin transporter FmnP